MKITFERYEKQGKHGDRATTLTTYYDYEIKIHREIPPGYMTVARFKGYDGWRESVKKQGDVRAEAENFISDLADIMGLPRPEMVCMVRKKVITEEWIIEEQGDA